MPATWRRQGGLVAGVLLLTPLLAVAQPRAREARPDRSPERASSAERSRGEVQVVNDWREAMSLSLRSENQERLGEWSIRPGEQVVLQERGERIRVRPNYTITVGDDEDWVEVGQIGQFRNGTWYVHVRDVWAATHPDRPVGRDARPSEGQPRDPSPRGEDSPLDQLLKKMQ